MNGRICKAALFDAYAAGQLISVTVFDATPSDVIKDANDAGNYRKAMIHQFFDDRAEEVLELSAGGVKIEMLKIFYVRTRGSSFGKKSEVYEGLLYLLLDIFPGVIEEYSSDLVEYSEITKAFGNMAFLRHQYFFLIHLDLELIVSLHTVGSVEFLGLAKLKILVHGCAQNCFDNVEEFEAHAIHALGLMVFGGAFETDGQINSRNRLFKS
jgi:hypothetical protein